jgi:hypothetical protein
MSAEPETSKKGLAKLDQPIEFRDPAQGANYHFMEFMRHFTPAIKMLTENILSNRLPGWLLIIIGAMLLTAWKWSLHMVKKTEPGYCV